MAKRHDPKDTQRKNPFLPDPDEYDFDDDLDSVTRNLPTEEEYLPKEPEEVAEEPVTEGTNRIGLASLLFCNFFNGFFINLSGCSGVNVVSATEIFNHIFIAT